MGDDTTRGLRELDVPALVEALARRARSSRGRALLASSPRAPDLATVRRWHDEVADVLRWEDTWGPLTVAGVEDVAADAARAARGARLESEVLMRLGRTLESLDLLAVKLADRAAQVPTLARFQPDLVLDAEIRSLLSRAFDETGQLSGRMWPELADARETIQRLHQQVRSTLEQLLRAEGLSESLQDRFVTQRAERYVLPIKANADRKAVGIVHDVSGSGQTLFIEPHEVVALNNEIRVAVAQLEAAERRVLAYLSAEVGLRAEDITRALVSAASVDAAVGRATLSRDLGGSRPEVGAKGVVRLVGARHPLLALRGVAVVGNDITLDESARVLVISGPNSGGKTIALKTVGLCAVLVSLGCFVPADEGSRVDWFAQIDALVGDRQGLDDAASSYAAQLSALAAMLSRTGPDQLVLIDEIGNGTDPEQGASLAAAAIEVMRDAGARVLVTTHLARLKTWAAAAERVTVAGMAFEGGHATFRLQSGHHGESHALEVAAKRGISTEIIERARVLLADGARDLAVALDALDRERRTATALRAQISQERDEIAAIRADLDRRREALARAAEEAAARQTAQFAERLLAAERAVSEVVAALQRAPSHRGVAQARALIEAVGRLAGDESSVSDATESAVEAWQVGDRVRARRGGSPGTIVSLGRKVGVRMAGGVTLQMDPTDLVRIEESPMPSRARSTPSKGSDKASPPPKPSLERAVRHAGNTVDLRGQRVEDAFDLLERYFSDAVAHDDPVVFVLHGHGTGALKAAIRAGLRKVSLVAAWSPASAHQGGDAYTAVLLR